MDVSSWEVFESIFSDKIFETASEVHSLACSDDYICAGLRQGQIHVFDLNNDTSFQLLSHTLTVNSLCLSNNKLISGGQDSSIIIWDLLSRSQEGNLPGHENVITCLDISQSTLYSASVDQTVKQWDILEVKSLHSVSLTSVPCCLKLAENIYIGTEEGSIEVYSYAFEKLMSLCDHLDAVWCLDIFGEIMVSGSFDGSIRLWNKERSEIIGEHEGVVNKVGIIDPSGAGIPMIISVGSDALVKLWALDGLKSVMEFHKEAVTALGSADMAFVTAGFDKKIRVWSLMNHLKIKKIKKNTNRGITDAVMCADQMLWIENGEMFSPNQKLLEQNSISAIACEAALQIIAYCSKNLVILHLLSSNSMMHSFETQEPCSSVAIFDTHLVACSASKIYSLTGFASLETRDHSSTCIDISSQFIITAGEKLTVWNKGLEIICDISERYEAVLHSRDEKYIYASNSEGVSLLRIGDLQRLVCIRSFVLYKRMKLCPGQGILCCDDCYITVIPEYDIEKRIMLPD